MEYDWNTIMTVEDSLQEAHVFVNGLSRKTCHSDSYMTIVDYAAFEAWKARKEFDKPTLEYCINYWLTNPNMQPPLRLIAMALERFLKTI